MKPIEALVAEHNMVDHEFSAEEQESLAEEFEAENAKSGLETMEKGRRLLREMGDML